ncbi:PREDICTED: prorelaxin H2 [Propithecus coquereli]|uniref:Insulin-like domain-containing protein n=1 Tax=Propithecus coquereli TaxID=379532 RepID=A0A2K6F6W8_PROCO|nr:PREDICTED: prorelaxin H2 [Propithecus coquereli]
MPRLFLFHLLGVWLLLSQLSRANRAEWMDHNIKSCGRELARRLIAICGMSSSGRMALSQKEPPLGSAPKAEIVPFFIHDDAETVNMMSEFIANLPQERKMTPSERQPSLPELQHLPTLKDSNIGFEEFKKIIHNRESEADDDSPSALKYLGLDTHSRKKRDSSMSLFDKCCQIGCTGKSLSQLC